MDVILCIGEINMTLPTSKYLKKKALNRLASGNDPQKVILYYAGITFATSFLVMAVRYYLGSEISQTGGLSNIGLRSILSTADSVLPILQSVLMMCLNLGYLAAMLRIARRQYASPKTLKAGAERFWVLLRKNILVSLYYIGAGVAAFYLSILIFMISPLSSAFTAAALPMIEQANFNAASLAMDETLLNTLAPTMLPLFILIAVVMLLMELPIFYRFRLTDYLIVDQPGSGALSVIQQSRFYMRGNSIGMLKLDLSFWWFYLLQTASTGLAYLDVILAQFGVTLPLPDAVVFLGTFALYLAADFAIMYYFKNRVAVTYALAYDSLIPHQKNEGVVLGNIFQN